MVSVSEPGVRLKFGATTDTVTVKMLLSAPEVPVTVTMDVPTGATPLAMNVSVLVFVTVTALKEAVTPVGRPETARLTLPVKLFCASTLIAVPALVPGFKEMPLAEAVRPKLGVMTRRLMPAMLLRVPEVPEIVIAEVPAAAELLAVNVAVVLLAVLAGLNDTVTPTGNPEATSTTLPVKPFWGITVITLLLVLPGFMEKPGCEDDKVNVAGWLGTTPIRSSINC
jgi:hypothetical protein